MVTSKIKQNTIFVTDTIKQITRGSVPTSDRITQSVRLILENKVRNKPIFMGALFTSLMMIKDPDEKFRMADSALRACLSLDKFLEKEKIVLNRKTYSICGSGKDDLKTLNVSTIASFIASVAGVCVAKNGAPGTASLFGSSDFFHFLGLDYERSTIRKMAKGTEDIGYGFFAVQKVVPNLFQSYDASFYYPTILSYGLLALVTPVKLDGIVYGISDPEIELSARILQKYGYKNSLVVTGMDHSGAKYIDELSVLGKSKIMRIDKNGKIKQVEEIDPREFGITRVTAKHIRESKNIGENYNRIIKILSGQGTKEENYLIALNAASLLLIAGYVDSIKDGYKLSLEIIKSGEGLNKLRKFIKYHNLNEILYHEYALSGK